ncbi:MAG: BrnA antitoxin family protein [Pseudomonadales bacterium]
MSKKLLPKIPVMPTDEEDEAINQGIAQDPDAFEPTDEQLASMQPIAEVDSRRYRGPQKAPKKDRTTIALDSDLLALYRAMGKGWQTRLNDDLRKANNLGSAERQ